MNGAFVESWTFHVATDWATIAIDLSLRNIIVMFIAEALFALAAIGIESIAKINIVQGMLLTETVRCVLTFDLMFACSCS